MFDLAIATKRGGLVLPWAGRARAGLRSLWAALPAVGRIGLAGVLASAVIAVALGVYIPVEVRKHLLTASGRGLEAAVIAIQPSMPDLERGPLVAAEIAHLDEIVGRAILDSDHVRAKLWSLDGVILYADVHEIIGRSFPDLVQRLRVVADGGVVATVSDLGHPENESERAHGSLVEYCIPVRAPDGRAVAVFEIYEDVSFLEEALAGITLATWLAIGSGLSVLMVFLIVLVTAAVQSINRDRAAAETRAAELTVLVGAADALASSLEPREFLARLDARVRQALGLSRFTREPRPTLAPGAVSIPLRDGSWLVAQRASGVLSDQDERLLRSVASSLDAALSNAVLFAQVRDAAQARRALLRKVVEAHEDERRHIVGELHDSMAAELIRVLYGIRGIAARRHDLPDEVEREIADLERLVSRAEEDLRAFMGRIRPSALDEFGLRVALEAALDRFRSESKIAAELRVHGRPEFALPSVQLVVLRSAEEALLNVRKHAAASRVRVTIQVASGRLRMTVDDDGVGWRQDPEVEDGHGLGMAYLRERVAGFGGRVHTANSSLGGARLTVDLPLEP